MLVGVVGISIFASIQVEELWQRAGDYEKGLEQYRLSYDSLVASQQSSSYTFVEELMKGSLVDSSSMLRQLADRHHLVVISMEEKSNYIQFVFQGTMSDYLLFWNDWNEQHPLLTLDVHSVTANASFLHIEGSVFVSKKD